ncbi:hypothetical protein [Streptomyces sp. NPDC051173]
MNGRQFRNALRWLPILANTNCPSCNSPFVWTPDGRKFICQSCGNEWT